MAANAPPSERLHETFLRHGQVRLALKTSLACCLATGLSYCFHLTDAQLAPLLAFLFMTRGLPNPSLNWLLAQVAIEISAVVSAFLLLALEGAPFLYVPLTLLLIFTFILFANWFSLPATLGALVSAIGIFVKLYGTVDATLDFYKSYELSCLFAGFSVVVVHTLLWPLNTSQVFSQTLAEAYDSMEKRCRQAATRIRSGKSIGAEESVIEWAPFRPLRRLLAPELRRTRDTSNPFALIILACRSLTLRLWFFGKSVAPLVPTALGAEASQALSSILDRCAGCLHTLFEGAVHRKQVPQVPPDLLEDLRTARQDTRRTLFSGDVVLAWRLLHLVVQALQSVTTRHNALLTSWRQGMAGALVALRPIATGTRLIDENSLRAGAKLVIMLLLLMAGELSFGRPGGQHVSFSTLGGQQVAFFAVFFASTGNLGQQNKNDLVGLAGLLVGFAYGIVAAFLTSRLPQFPLLLALVFLGEYLAALVFLTLPRYSAAGQQGGLALFFAYLATPGPAWGSFNAVWTRFEGLVVAGFTAIVIHAYLWPVLPMRQLRDLIAVALKDTAVSLNQLLSGSRPTWEGAPPSLGNTVRRALDLLDDARYLPGPDHADPAYHGILSNVQEIDANLDYVHFLLGLEAENPLQAPFFQAASDYAEQAQMNLERVAQQFQRDLRLAARLEAIHWEPDVLGRWRLLSPAGPLPGDIDPGRFLVIARCLDKIAQATERISAIAREINIRNARI